MRKITDVLTSIFAIGVLVCLFAGGLSILGYIVALIVGGTTAECICSFVFTQYLPWVIKITTVFVFIGLISMYFSKKKALVIEKEDN